MDLVVVGGEKGDEDPVEWVFRNKIDIVLFVSQLLVFPHSSRQVITS
jgi:hypothetical protein